ncbi:MAG: leucine-rich repeat domain-containing protein [Promethearchaeota archaeon]
MELNPDYIKENLSEIGKKEALTLLRELINSSNDPNIRKRALQTFGCIDEGKNFSFFEQLFLSDEDPYIRKFAGMILKEKYFTHKKIIRLLEYTLKKVDNVDQKIFSIKVLNSMENMKAVKIVVEYLKEFLKTKYKNETNFLQYGFDYSRAIPENYIKIFINLILADFYENKCGYLVTLKKGKIIALSCEGSNLGEVSDIYGFNLLSDLQHLSIQRNNLTKITHLQHLIHLKTLILSNNKLERIENLEYLSKLEELNLSNNKIGKIENLDPLLNLKKLSLSDNLIKSIENLNLLLNLETLDLSHNYISEIENMEKLENLQRLNLSSNKIEKIQGLSCLRNLMWLYLNDNNIVTIECLSTQSKLKGLYLSNNIIKRISSLENLIGLKKLELSNNKISKLEGLENLGELQELYLDNNQIKTIESLEGLNNLIMLHIGRNEIEEFRKELVEHLKNLNFLFLNENPLNQKSFAEYQKRIRFP